MRGLILALLVLLAACGRNGEDAPPEPTAQTDTLAGFRLGMLRTEADSAAALRGDTLVCSEAQPLGTVKRARCSWGPEASRLEFMNNQLVSIRVLAAPEGGEITPGAVAAQLESGGYGPPAFELHGRSVSYPFRSFWVAPDSSSRLELFCPDTVAAAGCQLLTRLATPAQVRRMAAGN